jgi:RHS repeat-associated protein
MTNRMGVNLQSWSSYNYPTWVSTEGLQNAENISFNYGPDRQRWYQGYSGNGITEYTYYVGSALEVVLSGGVTNYRHYIYAGNEPVAVYSRLSSGTNTVDYVLQDHQGSVAALTDSNGNTVVSESFTPYGNRRNPSTWSGAASNLDLTTAAGITRQAYTFQTQLGLWMGLNHMNGRVEDSITGRFMSADPNIPDPTDPQSYNRYSYVVNNPVTYFDPTGFDGECDVPGSLATEPGGTVNLTPVAAQSPGTCAEVVVTGCRPNSTALACIAPGIFNLGSLFPDYNTQPGPYIFPNLFGGGASGTPGQSPPPNNCAKSNPNSSSDPQCQQPQTNPNQCPNPGFWSNVGNALTNFGSDVHGAGTEASRIGAVTAVVGAGAARWFSQRSEHRCCLQVEFSSVLGGLAKESEQF